MQLLDLCSELRCLRQLLAVLDHFCELKLAFVRTKFQQKEQVKGITNQSLIEYIFVLKAGVVLVVVS